MRNLSLNFYMTLVDFSALFLLLFSFLLIKVFSFFFFLFVLEKKLFSFFLNGCSCRKKKAIKRNILKTNLFFNLEDWKKKKKKQKKIIIELLFGIIIQKKNLPSSSFFSILVDINHISSKRDLCFSSHCFSSLCLFSLFLFSLSLFDFHDIFGKINKMCEKYTHKKKSTSPFFWFLFSFFFFCFSL